MSFPVRALACALHLFTESKPNYWLALRRRRNQFLAPAGPFETHLALPNHMLVKGACHNTPPLPPCGRSWAAILLCHLSPMAARSACSPARLRLDGGSPARVLSQSEFRMQPKAISTLLIYNSPSKKTLGVVEKENAHWSSSRLALREDASQGPAPLGMGGERFEQPMDSDGTAKLLRRNARRAAGRAMFYMPS